MVGAIMNALEPAPGAEALLPVNGFGGTPAMELYLMVNSALRVLRKKGLNVSRFLTGNYVTSLDMAGWLAHRRTLPRAWGAHWCSPPPTPALRLGAFSYGLTLAS